MSLLGRAARFGMRRGWEKGVREGSPPWLVIGALSLIGYLAGKALHREPEVVFSEKLKAGESIRITHEAAPL